MTQLHNAYLAGLIDGEGYLALLPARTAGLKQLSFEPVIKIGMTGATALVIAQTLQEKYGGHINDRSKLTTGGRKAYTYIAKSKKRVSLILEDILPYLIVKRDQALLLQEFCNLGSSHSNYKTFDEVAVTRKGAIYHELRRLKEPEPLATTN